MKVQKTSTQPAEFQPIEIKITIETQEEFDTFLQLTGCNITVSRAVSEVSNSEFNLTLCEQMLGRIFRNVFSANSEAES